MKIRSSLPTNANANELVSLLEDPGQPEDVRSEAALALGTTSGDVHTTVPTLIRALKDQSAEVRRNAADGLARIGTKASAAVPDLIEALGDEEARVRGAAARALGGIGAEAKAGVPSLVAALRDGGWTTSKCDYVLTVSQDAAAALCKIDPEVARQAGVRMRPDNSFDPGW